MLIAVSIITPNRSVLISMIDLDPSRSSAVTARRPSVA
jgi:hypothetical protein